MNYYDMLDVSIRAYYKDTYSQYFRKMKLDEIPIWLDAHQYTHPECTGYSIQISISTNKGSGSMPTPL